MGEEGKEEGKGGKGRDISQCSIYMGFVGMPYKLWSSWYSSGYAESAAECGC